MTYRDIATKAGVSTCLVSRALNGKTGVSAVKRKRILKIASDLGYRKNPAARLLAGQRHGHRERPLLALLRVSDHMDDLFRKACRDGGADMMFVSPNEAASPHKLSETLYARGVDGIVINPHFIPLEEPEWSAFHWDRFALATLSRHDSLSHGDLVRHNAFDYLALTLEHMVNAGCRRIAAILHTSDSQRDDDARLGALLSLESRYADQDVQVIWQRLGSIKEAEASVFNSFGEKALKWGADALLIDHYALWWRISELKIESLMPLPCASVFVPDEDEPWFAHLAGCRLGREQLYRSAVDLLLNRIGRVVASLDDMTMEHVVEPIWKPGSSLPRSHPAQK